METYVWALIISGMCSLIIIVINVVNITKLGIKAQDLEEMEFERRESLIRQRMFSENSTHHLFEYCPIAVVANKTVCEYCGTKLKDNLDCCKKCGAPTK